MEPLNTGHISTNYTISTEIKKDKLEAAENIKNTIIRIINSCTSVDEAQQIKKVAKLAIKAMQDNSNQVGNTEESFILIRQQVSELGARAKDLFEDLTQGNYQDDLKLTSTYRSFAKLNKTLNTYFPTNTNYTNTNKNLIKFIDEIDESELLHKDGVINSIVSRVNPLPSLPEEVYLHIFSFIEKPRDQSNLRKLCKHSELLVGDTANLHNPLRFLKLKVGDVTDTDKFKTLLNYIASPKCATTNLALSGINLNKEVFNQLCLALKNNQSITHLYFASCNLSDQDLENLSFLPKLISLDVRNNNIGYVGAKRIASNMPNLTYLNISNNFIKLGIQYFLQLTALEVLVANSNAIITLPLSSWNLSRTEILTTLLLHDNYINLEELIALSIFKNLTTLGFGHFKAEFSLEVTKKIAKALEKLTDLHVSINASFTNQEFSIEELPNLRIKFISPLSRALTKSSSEN